MKYPGVPPAGSRSADTGWDLAGSDLGAAADRLRGAPGLQSRVQLAEVLRRAFRIEDALAVLHAGPPDERDDPLVLIAEGNALWTRGDGRSAKLLFERALRVWRAADHAEGTLAAVLGVARCARIAYRRRSRRIIDYADDIAAGVDDIHLLADLDRERAAWDLLVGAHDEALAGATRAAQVHRLVGDRYLSGLADVLRARALNALEDVTGAIDLVRAAVGVGAEIGSVDLELVVGTVYLGQFLQRGVTPDDPRWVEAEEVLTSGLDRATDPFTRAEMLLPLAHLHTTSGVLALAEAELTEYERIYTVLGGNQISTGNLRKARARLEFARSGGMYTRGIRRTVAQASAAASAMRTLRKSARAYRKAGLEPAWRSVEWHISLVDVLSEGDPEDAAHGPRPDDRLGRARYHLLAGEVLRCRGSLREADGEYEAAESNAVAAGSTMLAVAAASGAAEIGYALGDHPGARAALRRTVDHAERIRSAILPGTARSNVAAVVRGHYERALLFAARMDDGALALEIIERLRTERLAGLLRRTSEALPADVTELLSQLDDINDELVQRDPGVRRVRARRRNEELSGVDPDELHARRSALRARLAERTSELFADTYGAEPLHPDRLAALGADVLAILPVEVDGESAVVSVWRSARSGATAVTVVPLDGPLAALRDVVIDRRPDGWLRRIELTWRDLRPLEQLLPEPLRAATTAPREPVKLVVVPSGWFWAVPFAAVPVRPDGCRLLVDHTDIALSPSLRFYTAQQARSTRATPRAAASWVDPDSGITADEVGALRIYPDGYSPLDGPNQIRDAFVRGGARWCTAVLAAHGNSEPGLAHAALAAQRSVLTAADFFDGGSDPPSFLSFASCHSAYPDGEDPHEPLGIALAALSAGCRNVLSAHFEIDSENGAMTRCLAQLYERMAETDDAPAALARILRDPIVRDRVPPQPLFRWAALAVIGTHGT